MFVCTKRLSALVRNNLYSVNTDFSFSVNDALHLSFAMLVKCLVHITIDNSQHLPVAMSAGSVFAEKEAQ